MKKCILLLGLALVASDLCFSQNVTKRELLEDLLYYRDTLPVKHKNLFNKISRADFERKISNIASKIDSLTFETFIAELFRLNVSIGDEHTRIEPKYLKYLPIKFESFDDGLFVIGITPEDSAFLLYKLIAINGHSIEEINKKFKEVIKDDNKSYFEVYQQRFLNNPSFLKGLGILMSDKEAEITLQNSDHIVAKVRLNALHKDSLKLRMASQYKTMLSHKGGDKAYWFEYDTSRKIIYFNFAICIDDPKNPFPEFNKELFSTIKSVSPNKIIVDLRFNSGGNSGVLEPFIDSIKQSYLNKKGCLFVLIGKSTFSSSLMNAIEFKRQTEATLVGQMTSGNINHYGEVRGFRLPHTRIVIGYSTKYWENWKGKKGALFPDKAITYRSKSFKKNEDEAIEYIYRK